MHRQRIVQLVVFALFLIVAPVTATQAQPIPATPVPGAAPTGVLAEFHLNELPTPHAEVWFLRMGLEPGGSLPAGALIGPLILYVERGAIALSSDHPVQTTSMDVGATPVAPDASPASEMSLVAGDAMLADDGAEVTITNGTGEPATFLVLLMFPAEREGESSGTQAEPVGLTQQGISIANAEFPATPGTVTIERLIVSPGETWMDHAGPTMTTGALDLGAVEQGAADVTFMMGTNWLWPSILTDYHERQPIYPGQPLGLAAGDGYSSYEGSSTWRVTSDEPLIVLRVTVMPDQ